MASKSLTLSSLAAVMVLMMMLAVASSEKAQAPAVDCSNVILNLADCLSYVTNGSTTEKPEGTCCSGMKTVLKAAPECLCEGFKSSAQFGVVLNVTKAFQLPAACGVSAPSATKCALSDTPSASPALSPSQQSSSAPSGDGISSGNSQAPSPSPRGHTGSAVSISFPIGSMLVGLVVASLSCF